MNSYRDPAAKWLGSPNFSLNRDGHYIAAEDPDASYIVLHTMVGTVASANSRFQQAAQQASAHYGVGYNGSLVQWVDEKDAAWHAGNYAVNLDSIGIEHEDMGKYNDPRPDALYQASAKLVARICKRYNLPCQRGDKNAGRSGCIDHRSVSATACPDALDTNRIIREAAAYLKFLRGQGPDPYAPPPPPPVPSLARRDVRMRASVVIGGRRDAALRVHVSDLSPAPPMPPADVWAWLRDLWIWIRRFFA